jgi:hypothetical protein
VAVDIQFVYPQEVIKVTSVRRVPDVTPPMLDIVGEDFRAVATVEINEILAPSFTVLTKNKLRVEVPELVTNSGDIYTVTVTSQRLVLTSKSFFRFRMGAVPGKVKGILKLCQLFVKILFTTPGSDIFSPKTGGAGLKNLGMTFSSLNTGSIVSDFVISVQNTARQITAIQSRTPGLAADEKLLSAKVVQSNFSAQETALNVTVELTSQGGNSAIVNLVL